MKTAEGKLSAVDLTFRNDVERTLQMLLIPAGIMMGRENALLPLDGGVLVTPTFHIEILFYKIIEHEDID